MQITMPLPLLLASVWLLAVVVLLPTSAAASPPNPYPVTITGLHGCGYTDKPSTLYDQASDSTRSYCTSPTAAHRAPASR